MEESGLNTFVDHGGRRYHVQTQFSFRPTPVIESLVFHGGQALVRMTATYEDVAQRLGFNGDDGRHLLELQHADLIRKIRHGMLGGGEDDRPRDEAAGDESPRLVDSDGVTVDPGDVEDPSVLALLDELGVKIDSAFGGPEPPRESPEPPRPPEPRDARATARPSPPAPPVARPRSHGVLPGTRPVHAGPACDEELPWWRRLRVRLRF